MLKTSIIKKSINTKETSIRDTDTRDRPTIPTIYTNTKDTDTIITFKNLFDDNNILGI